MMYGRPGVFASRKLTKAVEIESLTTPLLTTKLHIPPVRTACLLRPWLHAGLWSRPWIRD